MSSTIWALTDATSAVATQRIPVATAEASGSNAYITPAYLAAYVAAAMTAISITGGTVTSSTPVLDATQTWSTTATYTGIKLNITDSGPSNAASLLMDLQVGGSSKAKVDKVGISTADRFLANNVSGAFGYAFQGSSTNLLRGDSAGFAVTSSGGVAMASTQYLGWSSTSNWFNTQDLFLRRDAANTLALRNSTNAQTLNIYKTYTDSSNYERLAVYADAFNFNFEAQFAGTGSRRALVLGGNEVYFSTQGASRWAFSTGGHLLAQTDNTYDIGASGATRPRSIYVGTNISYGGSILPTAAGSQIAIGQTGVLYWNTRTTISSAADGVIMLANLAQTDFGRLQFGGTTSSFPAIKRSSAALQARLADDSAYAAFAAANLTVNGQAVIPVQTLTDGANIAWNVNAGGKATVTLGGSRTMDAVTNATEGATYVLWVVQDATGSRTITWTTSGAGSFDFGAAGAPTLTTTANAADVLMFEAKSLGGTVKLRYCGVMKGYT